MRFMFILLIVIVILYVCLYIYGFNKTNDLTVPTKDISDLKNIKKVLLIFPHPDDEANSLSGTVTQFVKNNIQVDWIILSKGEKGNEDARYEKDLKETRVNEANKVAKILRVKNLIIKDYPDNGILEFKDKLTTDLKQTIKDMNPNLVITYDESGGYGHPDHIVVSKIVTDLVNTTFTNTQLWYTSTPKKLFDELNLPEQMAKDKGFKADRKYPNNKIWIGIPGLFNKIKVIYTYQSQFGSFVKTVPIKQIPMWFYISLTPYEYFYNVK